MIILLRRCDIYNKPCVSLWQWQSVNVGFWIVRKYTYIFFVGNLEHCRLLQINKYFFMQIFQKDVGNLQSLEKTHQLYQQSFLASKYSLLRHLYKHDKITSIFHIGSIERLAEEKICFGCRADLPSCIFHSEENAHLPFNEYWYNLLSILQNNFSRHRITNPRGTYKILWGLP